MNTTNKIILHLIKNAKPFLEIDSFSDSPGIYAFFFYGDDFPLAGYSPKKGEIIYIGKTESSQKKRDADTHFASGKTGSSTVRKSFGSLLREELGLKPIPRGQADINVGRTAAFKFNDESEAILTNWMKNNLGLSFFEYNKEGKEISKLEEALIRQVIPVINIDKNPNSLYIRDLKSARKKASEIAYSGLSLGLKSNTKIGLIKQNRIITGNIHKYEDIWDMLLPQIRKGLKDSIPTEIQLQKEYFDKVGNRKLYSFNLEFINGRIANNVGGSAVARDLARVMQSDDDIQTTLNNKHIKIRMDKYFTVYIKRV